jgi:hypothetical protein
VCSSERVTTCEPCEGINATYQAGWVLRQYTQCETGFYRAPCSNRLVNHRVEDCGIVGKNNDSSLALV